MERNTAVHGEGAWYFDFVVELRGIEPRIWRRFLLRLDQTFEDLHKAIQDAAGWQDYQLYRFWNPANGKMIAHKYERYLNRCPEPPGGILPLSAYFSDDVRTVVYNAIPSAREGTDPTGSGANRGFRSRKLLTGSF